MPRRTEYLRRKDDPAVDGPEAQIKTAHIRRGRAEKAAEWRRGCRAFSDASARNAMAEV